MEKTILSVSKRTTNIFERLSCVYTDNHYHSVPKGVMNDEKYSEDYSFK